MDFENNKQSQDAGPQPEAEPSAAVQPEQVKQVVEEYSQIKDTTTRKKVLFISIIICFGIALIAFIYLIAKASDGSKTDANVEQLQNEVIPSGPVEGPDTL